MVQEDVSGRVLLKLIGAGNARHEGDRIVVWDRNLLAERIASFYAMDPVFWNTVPNEICLSLNSLSRARALSLSRSLTHSYLSIPPQPPPPPFPPPGSGSVAGSDRGVRGGDVGEIKLGESARQRC
jgi:hypothetical protein